LTSRFRFRPPLPRSADGSRLPAILAVVLVLVLAFQLVMTHEPDLPRAGVVPLVPLPEQRAASIVVTPPILERRPIFAPRDIGGGAASGAAIPLPLDGAVATGFVSVGSRVTAVLQTPSGGIVRLRPGARYRGWMLVAVTSSGAKFRRGGESMTMTYGAAAQAAAQAEPSEDETP